MTDIHDVRTSPDFLIATYAASRLEVEQSSALATLFLYTHVGGGMTMSQKPLDLNRKSSDLVLSRSKAARPPLPKEMTTLFSDYPHGATIAVWVMQSSTVITAAPGETTEDSPSPVYYFPATTCNHEALMRLPIARQFSMLLDELAGPVRFPT